MQFLTDIQQWAASTAIKFGEPLINALVACATGVATAAYTGNVVSGIQIAATGIGQLLIAVLRAQPPVAKGFAVQSRSLLMRAGLLLSAPVVLLALVGFALVVGGYCWLRRKTSPQKN